MVIKTSSALLIKGQVQPIEIEVDCRPGIPQLILIGLATQALHEARERLLSALNNSGVRLKSKRTIINLSPTELKKTSPYLDLAIAVALLQAAQVIPPISQKILWLGELSLSGEIKPHPDLVEILNQVNQDDYEFMVGPELSSPHPKITYQQLGHLQEVIASKGEIQKLPTHHARPQVPTHFTPDFRGIHGQVLAKRALKIALAGGHHCLLIGPPGIGKSLLVSAAAQIMPDHLVILDPLSAKSAISAMKINLDTKHHQTMLATLHNCPCGGSGSSTQHCHCSMRQRQQHLTQVTGPFFKEFAIMIKMEEEKVTQLPGNSSFQIRQQLQAARRIQYQRYKNPLTNSEVITLANWAEFISFTEGAKLVWEKLQNQVRVPRQLEQILCVARTIADLDQSDPVNDQHLWEAFAYQLPKQTNTYRH